MENNSTPRAITSQTIMTLDKKQLKEIILKLIQDNIMFLRVTEGINKALSAYEEDGDVFTAEHKYYGYDIILDLLGIPSDYENEGYREKFQNLFFTRIMNDSKKADDLAKDIYVEFLEIIQQHYALVKVS